MRTPKKYTDNLKQGIITKEMLSDCLYSVNKRAKNCRDKQRAYYGIDSYADKYREQKEKYYGQKEILLHLVQPACIHMETVQRKQRIYDYEPEYDEYFYNGLFFHEGGFYDREMRQYVCFGDVYAIIHNWADVTEKYSVEIIWKNDVKIENLYDESARSRMTPPQGC